MKSKCIGLQKDQMISIRKERAKVFPLIPKNMQEFQGQKEVPQYGFSTSTMNTLTIDFLISQTASNKYPMECENVKHRYDEFFNQKTTRFNWNRNPNVRSSYVRPCVDISKLSGEEILNISRKLTRLI